MKYNSVLQIRLLTNLNEKRRRRKKVATMLCAKAAVCKKHTHIISVTLKIKRAGESQEWERNSSVIVSGF